MSIRIRRVGGCFVAMCAVETDPESGDIYLDDDLHLALAAKFARDWHGEVVDWRYEDYDRLADTQKVRDAKEEHERWDREEGRLKG